MNQKIFSSDNSILVNIVRGCMIDLRSNVDCCAEEDGHVNHADSTSIALTGFGTEIPLIATAIISPDAGNSLSVLPNGLYASTFVPGTVDFADLTGTDHVLLDTVVYDDPAWLNTLDYAKIVGAPSIPNSTSDLINDSGFLVAADIANKVDKITGKGLSTEDYSTAEKGKLAGIATGATNVTNNNQIANGAGYITNNYTGNFTVTGQLKSGGPGADLVLGDRQNAHVSIIYRDDDITRYGGQTRAGAFTYPIVVDGDAQTGSIEITQTGALKFGSLVGGSSGYVRSSTVGLLSAQIGIPASDITSGTLPTAAFPALTGDITNSAGNLATTLATVNSNVGSFGSATQVATFTVNAKGLVTAASNTTIAIPESAVTNLTTDLSAKEATANKDATGGYVGLTLFKINFENAANTFTSFFTNTNTAARTYTAPDKDITIAGTVDIPNGSYRTIKDASASHTAALVAGTYSLSNGNASVVSGAGSLYPIAVIHLASADYPTVAGVTTKLRVKAIVEVNDVAPTGNFTFGLYPITRPATSGGAALDIYTLGTVTTGSTVLFTTPAADSQGFAVSTDFAFPADGFYVLGLITTATVATSSHLHLYAQLQMRNQ